MTSTYNREYYLNRKEKQIAASKAWNAKNKDKTREYVRKWDRKNPEKMAEAVKRWYKNNRETVLRKKRMVIGEDGLTINQRRYLKYKETYGEEVLAVRRKERYAKDRAAILAKAKEAYAKKRGRSEDRP